MCSHFRLLNNNMCAYGGTIQGSLVRQRAANRGIMVSGLDETPEYELEPLVEVSPATLRNNPGTRMCL